MALRHCIDYALVTFAHPSLRERSDRKHWTDVIRTLGLDAAYALTLTPETTPAATERRARYHSLHYVWPELTEALSATAGYEPGRDQREVEPAVKALLLNKRR